MGVDWFFFETLKPELLLLLLLLLLPGRVLIRWRLAAARLLR